MATQQNPTKSKEEEKMAKELYWNEVFESAYRWRNLWVPLTGFFLLSPGLILTIPPNNGRWQGLFFSMQTNFWAIVIHTIVFGIWVLLWNIYFTSEKQKRLIKAEGGMDEDYKLPWDDFPAFFERTEEVYQPYV